MQHWHLDVTFKEDECRARMGFTSQNLSVLRKIALHIVSEQKDKLSMKRRLYKAALDINYLKKLLEFLYKAALDINYLKKLLEF